MTSQEWVALIAGVMAILGGFIAALRWTVHQFVLEIGSQLFQRMDRIEAEIGVLTDRQSDIYATIMTERGSYGSAKDKSTKARKSARKRTSR